MFQMALYLSAEQHHFKFYMCQAETSAQASTQILRRNTYCHKQYSITRVASAKINTVKFVKESMVLWCGFMWQQNKVLRGLQHYS